MYHTVYITVSSCYSAANSFSGKKDEESSEEDESPPQPQKRKIDTNAHTGPPKVRTILVSDKN